IPDGTQMTPGQSFTKTWTIRNSGTTTWNSGYKLSWVSGEIGRASCREIVRGTVSPGSNYKFSSPMTATTSSGTDRDEWRCVSACGSTIPVSGSQTIWVITRVSGGCDGALFVSELIPDGTQMTPGQSFTKTWTIRNSGTTTWNSGYKLSWVSG